MTPGARLAAAADGLVGCRFRLRGRDPTSGLDCVGVAAVALARCGKAVPVPQDYQMRNDDADRVAALLPGFGFIATEGRLQSGDLVVLKTGPSQIHLALCAADGGFIHAHAGLRKVVKSPVRPEGELIGIWRLVPQT